MCSYADCLLIQIVACFGHFGGKMALRGMINLFWYFEVVQVGGSLDLLGVFFLLRIVNMAPVNCSNFYQNYHWWVISLLTNIIAFLYNFPGEELFKA